MAERILKNRKRRKASKGQLIRVSDAVAHTLSKTYARDNNRNLSWDVVLRRLLGLPDRKGMPQGLVEGYLEVNTGKFYFDAAEARGAAVVAAAKAKTKRLKQPIFMREVAGSTYRD